MSEKKGSTELIVVSTLLDKVTSTIEGLLDERKLKWLSETEEFKEGLLIGLELAGIYGNEIHKLYITDD